MLPLTTFSPPNTSALVLGLAVGRHTLVAVGGQGRDLLLVARGSTKFVSRNSKGRGLRGALVRGDAEIWVCGEYGHVARSLDGGRSFEQIPTGLSSGGCMFGVVEDKAGAVWVAGDNGYIAKSVDGGKLKKVKGTKESIGRIRAADIGILIPTDDGHLFIGEGNKIRKTALEAEVMLMATLQTKAGTLIVVGKNGHIWRSVDAGETWTRTQTGSNVLLCGVAQLKDGTVVVVGFSGTVLVSTDEGHSFTLVPQTLESDSLWCAEAFGPGALIGCPQSQVALLGEAGVLDAAPPVLVEEKDESHLPLHWRAPVPSTTKQATWVPKSVPVQEVDGIYVSDWLRRALHPRRGGIETFPRPLPSVDEAWSALRRALWAADNANMEQSGERSGIWELATSHNMTDRRLGERILNASPQSSGTDDDSALVSLSLKRYRTFIKQYQPLVFEALADFLVASVGVAEASRRMLIGLDDELPYVGVGPFGRLRELLVLADDDSFAEARKMVVEVTRVEVQGSSDRDRIADLQWAASFLLPLGPGTDSVEIELHSRAMENVGQFGNFCVHACGLAAGDLSTLERFLQANGKVRHEFFSPFDNHLYLASVLEIAGRDAGPIFAKMKPASPFDDDALRNGLWCMLLAHVDDPEARLRLVDEHRANTAWGTAAMRLAFSFNPEEMREIARDDDAFADPLLRNQYDYSQPDLGEITSPSAYVPLASTTPAFDVATDAPATDAPTAEIQWLDEERSHANVFHITNGASVWNGNFVAELEGNDIDAFVAHRRRWAIPTGFADLALAPLAAQAPLRELGFRFRSYWAYVLTPLLLRDGKAAVPVLLAALRDPECLEVALKAALPVADVDVGRFVVDAFSGKKNKAIAREWILRHPEHAKYAALAAGDDKSKKMREAAARVLSFVDPENTSLNAYLKPKKVALPAWAHATELPSLDAIDGVSDPDTLLFALARSLADEPQPEVLAARKTYTAKSLAVFSWALFEAWLANGAPAKSAWCMQSVGFLGDDDSANRLLDFALMWPQEGASARAKSSLDVFVNLNTSQALKHVRFLSEHAGPAGLKSAAKERMHELIVRQGITADEFAELSAPGSDVDDNNPMMLDLGGRKILIVFGPDLEIRFQELDEHVVHKFPRTLKSDDKALVKQAKLRVKELEKEVAPHREEIRARFERLLRTGREIDVDVYKTAYVNHPWVSSIAARFVWSDGEPLLLGARNPNGPVHLFHPVEVDERIRNALGELVEDAAPPFTQFERPIFSREDMERQCAPLDDVELQMLTRLGWWQEFDGDRRLAVCPLGGPKIDVTSTKKVEINDKLTPRLVSEWTYDVVRARNAAIELREDLHGALVALRSH